MEHPLSPIATLLPAMVIGHQQGVINRQRQALNETAGWRDYQAQRANINGRSVEELAAYVAELEVARQAAVDQSRRLGMENRRLTAANATLANRTRALQSDVDGLLLRLVAETH